MLNKYPSQTNSRRVLAALGCAFIVLGIFLMIFDAVGQGVVLAVPGIMLDVLCFFASEKGYERAERFLSWFAFIAIAVRTQDIMPGFAAGMMHFQ